jgi:predicted metal-dependent hydrolase
LAGLAYATVMLGVFWFWGTWTLLRQERMSLGTALRQLREVNARDPVMRTVFLAGIRQYIRRGFHPRDNQNEHLAAEWLAARTAA